MGGTLRAALLEISIFVVFKLGDTSGNIICCQQTKDLDITRFPSLGIWEPGVSSNTPVHFLSILRGLSKDARGQVTMMLTFGTYLDLHSDPDPESPALENMQAGN